MKRLLTTALSTLSLMVIAYPSFAQEVAMAKQHSTKIEKVSQKQVVLRDSSNTMNQTNSVNLVGIAYQGFLRGQGIPSGGKFISQVQSGKITAKLLIQSGIDNGRLSPETIRDQSYLSAVETALTSFTVDQ